MAKTCESCGMPMARDKQGGGTESDGSKSITYCSLCYDDGTFRSDAKTAQEFQAECMMHMTQGGMWRPWAWLLTRAIPNQPRWSN
ncbi:MAG: zinc ribbon domain-containing protein [Planktomarina sp.]